MSQIYGAVEFRTTDEWYEVINVSSLLLQHSDLNGCLFGVDNYAGFRPLFADRGLPDDCSVTVSEKAAAFLDEDSHPSWVLWEELDRIDWDEKASSRDERISEYLVDDNGTERLVTKWLNEPGREAIRKALDVQSDLELMVGQRVFRRLVLRRADAQIDTEFPLLVKLMRCLAERFGEQKVRLVVWFG